MGSVAYWYFTPYKPNLGHALRAVREREFKAGRYYPAIGYIKFPITAGVQEPGPAHDSIEDAFEAAGEEGTRSILDINGIGKEPDFRVAVPLGDERLEDLFGTTQPTREQVESNLNVFDNIERGHAIYILVWEGEAPVEVFFAGYSFD